MHAKLRMITFANVSEVIGDFLIDIQIYREVKG